MKASLILCICVVSSTGCFDSGYGEIRAGHSAIVHVCGDWTDEQRPQIEAAIADWNGKLTLASGEAPYTLGDPLPDMKTYGEGQVQDGTHCIYRLISRADGTGNLTSYGRQLWQDLHVGQHKTAVFDQDDDIAVFDGIDPWPANLHPALQNVFAHELGHGGGMDHAARGSGRIMTAIPESSTVTQGDVDEFCRINACQ